MINNLVDQILKYPRPWILTGAGISTESGIPDFRSSGGIWDKVDPIENFSTWALHNNPEGFFTHGLPLFSQVLDADPNDGHIIVGELQKKRFLGPIITQNIDSLHQKGGALWVYEIHGHIRTATCMNCSHRITMDELSALVANGDVPPRCDCGGIYKPDVILFGDSMPDDFQDAIRLIRIFNSTDNMIIVIGSSLTVSPINTFPYEFEKLAILNNSPTALDNKAELIVTGTSGDIMQRIKEKLIALNKGQDLAKLPAGFLPARLANMIIDLRPNLSTIKGNSRRQEALGKLGADIVLLERFFNNYPNLETRQPIEQYLVSYNLELIQTVKKELKIDTDKIDSKNGYIPRSLNDIITSYFQALNSYVRQNNFEAGVAQEIAEQTIGLIGLYRHLGTLGIQTFDFSQADTLPDKIEELANRRNFKLDLEKALQDF